MAATSLKAAELLRCRNRFHAHARVGGGLKDSDGEVTDLNDDVKGFDRGDSESLGGLEERRKLG